MANESQKAKTKTKRERILEADDLQTEVVPVPEWDEKIEVRGMDGLSRAKFMRQVAEAGDVSYERWYPELIIATSFDPETGDKVFGPADRDPLNKKAGAALSRLGDVASRLSGLAVADVDEAEERLKSES